LFYARLKTTNCEETMFHRISFLFLICLNSLCLAKPPSLTPLDTKNKIHEILKAHVSYQKLSEEIIQRAFLNYLDEIDPLKTYFLENEVLEWTSPSDQLLQQTLQNLQSADFTL